MKHHWHTKKNYRHLATQRHYAGNDPEQYIRVDSALVGLNHSATGGQMLREVIDRLVLDEVFRAI